MSAQELTLKIDTTELTPSQVRLVRSLNLMIQHILTTDEESEFFESSAQVMKLCASLIKQSNFSKDKKLIPYAEQALEFSMDILQDHISNSTVISYDN